MFARARAVVVANGPFVAASVAALVLWHLAVRLFEIPNYLLPGPLEIYKRITSDWRILYPHCVVTAQEVLLGFSLGSGIGLMIAVLMTQSEFCERAIYPFLVLSQTFPKEALAPLLLVWFGFGILPKIVVSALICFFPVAINSARGLTRVDPLAIEVFRSLNASDYQIFVKLRLPSSLPLMFLAFKMAITLSVIGAVVGEFVGASAGLGYLIQIAGSQLATDLTFASLVVLGGMALLFFGIINMIESIVLRKHERVSYVSAR